MLRQRNSYPVTDGGGQQFGRFVPACAAAAVLFRAGQAHQAEFVELLPKVQISPNRRGGWVSLAVLVENGAHYFDEGRVDAGLVSRPGCHRRPNPRAITPRSTSLVPPRKVKPGRWSTAACTRVENTESGESSRSANSAMSPSVLVPSTFTTAAGVSAGSCRSNAPATAVDMWCRPVM